MSDLPMITTRPQFDWWDQKLMSNGWQHVYRVQTNKSEQKTLSFWKLLNVTYIGLAVKYLGTSVATYSTIVQQLSLFQNDTLYFITYNSISKALQ